MTAIIDGHVTTLIAGVVLAQYGTGPIKGFAVTLIVGVVVNIFTGVVVTACDVRLLGARLRAAAKLDLGCEPCSSSRVGKVYDFMGQRRYLHRWSASSSRSPR